MHPRAALYVATVAVGMFTVGCDLNTSPTGGASVPESPLSPASQRASALGALPSTDVLRVPVAFTIQPAAKVAIEACVGEAVTFTGSANVVAHQTTLPDGSTSLDLLHFNGQGAVAVGGSTGATYRLVGGDSNPIILAPSGTLTATFAANLRVIGPGDAKSFMAHILQHIPVTPAGDVTARVDFLSIECR